MKNVEIRQIFYSEITRGQCDPGFLLLDNSTNLRPDWREYWPIRQYFAGEPPQPGVAYGFLSPKFGAKTGLVSADVRAFVSRNDADVYLFSPYFDHSAYYRNMFEQAEANHPGILPTLERAFALFPRGESINALVMSSCDTVFSNYLVADGRFWDVWLTCCGTLFDVAEDGRTDLGLALVAAAPYVHAQAEAKVFAMERVASFLLHTGAWKVCVYDPMRLPLGDSFAASYPAELCVLDALKIAYQRTGREEYLERFEELRANILRMAFPDSEEGRPTSGGDLPREAAGVGWSMKERMGSVFRSLGRLAGKRL
jgi:hypothetical protein